MQITRALTLFTLIAVGLAVSATNVFAQQEPSAPTRLALEVTYYPGRNPAYNTVPGPDSKPSGSWVGMFARTASWKAPAAGTDGRGGGGVVSFVEGDAILGTVSVPFGCKAF